MANHQLLMRKAVLKTMLTLKHELEESIEVSYSADPSILDIRRNRITINQSPTVVQRVYLETRDSSSLVSAGWVVNAELTCCLLCLKEFSVFVRRHHCRACGLLICHGCASTTAYIKDFQDLGKLRVCNSCNPTNAEEVPVQNNTRWGHSIVASKNDSDGKGKKYVVMDNTESGPNTDELCKPGDAANSTSKDILAAQLAIETGNITGLLLQATRSVIAAPSTVSLLPSPGFVIKSKRLSKDRSKVFINVYYDSSIVDDHMLLLYEGNSTNNSSNSLNSLNCVDPSNNTITNDGVLTKSSSPGKRTSGNISPAPTLYSLKEEEREEMSFSENFVNNNYHDRSNHVVSLTNAAATSSSSNLTPHSSSHIPPGNIGYSDEGDVEHKSALDDVASSNGAASGGGCSPFSFFQTNTSSATTTSTNSTVTSIAAVNASNTVIPLIYICGEPSNTVDKEGNNTVLYSVVVSLSYFDKQLQQQLAIKAGMREMVNIKDPICINKILQIINKKFSDCLAEDNFVLPKIKDRYRGAKLLTPQCFYRNNYSVQLVNRNQLSGTLQKHNGSVCSDVATVVSSSSSVAVGNSNNSNGDAAASSRRHTFFSLPSRNSRTVVDGSNKNNKRHSTGNANISGSGKDSNSSSSNNMVINDDNASIVSDITIASHVSEQQRQYVRGSRRFSLFAARHMIEKSSVTSDMFTIKRGKGEYLSKEQNDALKEASLRNPLVLLGYQIILPYEQHNTCDDSEFQTGCLASVDESTIFVIIDHAKTNMRKSEYKLLSNNGNGNDSNSCWVRLMRSANKSGVEFRILRLALPITGNELADSSTVSATTQVNQK